MSLAGQIAALATRIASEIKLKAAKANNLSDLANAATARTNLGLGTAATHATGDYDAAGAAAAAQAAAIQRANHTGTQATSTITGLGDAAVKNTGTTAGTLAAGNDSRFTLPLRLQPTNGVGAGVDPNTLTDTGWYTGYSWAGSLTGYSIGTLTVVNYSPDWISQTFTTIEAVPRVLIRARHSGTTWGSWRPIRGTSLISTVSRPDTVQVTGSFTTPQVLLTTPSATFDGSTVVVTFSAAYANEIPDTTTPLNGIAFDLFIDGVLFERMGLFGSHDPIGMFGPINLTDILDGSRAIPAGAHILSMRVSKWTATADGYVAAGSGYMPIRLSVAYP